MDKRPRGWKWLQLLSQPRSHQTMTAGQCPPKHTTCNHPSTALSRNNTIQPRFSLKHTAPVIQVWESD